MNEVENDTRKSRYSFGSFLHSVLFAPLASSYSQQLSGSGERLIRLLRKEEQQDGGEREEEHRANNDNSSRRRRHEREGEDSIGKKCKLTPHAYACFFFLFSHSDAPAAAAALALASRASSIIRRTE